MSERLLRLKPARYMKAKVPISDTGTERLGMKVAGMLRRKRKITMMTSTTAIDSSSSTSCTEARMVMVRSVSTTTSTEVGIEALSAGSRCLMVSTTSMTLAPGWR